jgi:large subunit ribosomal protein L22
MLSTAKLSYLRISPRKVRLVADLIRGEKLEQAQSVLGFTRKKAALPILKLLNQALSNALQKDSRLDKGNVYISKIIVNEGPSYKRTFPRSRGRADIILKRTSHVTVVLDEIEKRAKKPPKVSKKKKVVKKEEKKEVVKTEKEERIKEKFKRLREEKPRPKRERGLRRFFRRKAI